MCVYLARWAKAKKIKERFGADVSESVDSQPTYSTSAYAYPLIASITSSNKNVVTWLQWGLVPRWVKDTKTADEIRQNTVNARAETLSEKPSFRHTLNSLRCIVPVDGFFEFREVNNTKYPYFIHLKDNEPFAIAALWDTWENTQTGELRQTVTLVTTEANDLMQYVHNRKKRMPAILTPANESLWLDASLPFSQVSRVLEPYESNQMEAHTVSRLITSRNQNSNTPDVIKPYTYSELSTLF